MGSWGLGFIRGLGDYATTRRFQVNKSFVFNVNSLTFYHFELFGMD